MEHSWETRNQFGAETVSSCYLFSHRHESRNGAGRPCAFSQSRTRYRGTDCERMTSAKIKNGRIVQSEEPLNLEMPFEALNGFITPTPEFYVRTHYPIPKIDAAKVRLRIEGEEEQPIE